MKTNRFIPFLLCCIAYNVQAQDLPGPAPNLQTLPAGSYIIPMDNTHQLNNAGYFNLRSYGLVVHLLNQSVKVKRVILSGKAKDAIDFSVSASQVKPTAGSAALRNFKAGPFVIFAADTAGVADLTQGFNNVQPAGQAARLFVTQADVTVDIRHILDGFKPKAAILNDGGNQAIHEYYMQQAGMTIMNYAVNSGANLMELCFTFASEPHNGNTGIVVDTTIARIKKFVQSGGNFLAQCEAIANYENNPLGRFQSTGGITVVNKALTATIQFLNPDLAYNQFEGAYNAMQGGSIRTWKLAAGSVPANNLYHTCQGSTQDDTVGTTVSKLKTGTGGLVFYLGNHSFTSLTDYNHINGMRMYMNAFLTPVAINNNCAINQPLYVRFSSFEAIRQGDHVQVSWNTLSENSNTGFAVERNTDGNWEQVQWVPSKAPGGNSHSLLNYQYIDHNLFSGVSRYRIREINTEGKSSYTTVRMVRGLRQGNELVIYPNPSGNSTVYILMPGNSSMKTISIHDMTGRMIRQIKNVTGSQLGIQNLMPGMYSVKVFCTETGTTKSKTVLVNR